MLPKTSISNANTYQDIGAFWDEHDTTEFGEQTKVEFDVSIQSQRRYYSLDNHLSMKLRGIARGRETCEGTLLTAFLYPLVTYLMYIHVGKVLPTYCYIVEMQQDSKLQKVIAMAENSVIRARIDENIKNEAAAVLADMGLSVSDAFRILLVRIAAEKQFPFDIHVPNSLTAKTLAASDRGEDVVECKDKADLFQKLGL